MAGSNPLFDDRFVDLLLDGVLDVTALCRLPAFTEGDSAERSLLDVKPGGLGPSGVA